MVWARLWTACLCLAQQPYYLWFCWKASALTVLAKFHGFPYLSGEQSEWTFWWTIPSPSFIPRPAQASRNLMTFACCPECHQGSRFWLIPHFVHLWTHLPNRQHRWFFLHTGCWRDIHRQPSVYIQCLIRGVDAEVNTCTQFYKCKRKKKCCWQVILGKGSRGLCNLPYPHGSGIAACDESSLLTVHHKTCSEILCPKLCIWLFCLFGDC